MILRNHKEYEAALLLIDSLEDVLVLPYADKRTLGTLEKAVKAYEAEAYPE